MKVLHLISSGGMYGAENMLVNLCRALERRGCKITVGVFRNRHQPHLEVAERLKFEGLAVDEIPCSGRLDWSAVRRISRLIRSMQIDVVHSHGYKGDVYAYLGALCTSIPLVATAHNWTDKAQVPSAYNVLDRIVLRRFSAVVAVSQGVAQVLRESGIRQSKILRISNGIDVASFERACRSFETDGQVTQSPAVGMVSRLVKEKGCEYFLRAAADVLSRFPRARFLLVGEGPERANLEQLARELRLQIGENIDFCGYRDDMPNVYASFDICVLPSFAEGMPMTILEAMAAGKPVIATSVGEIPQLVTPGLDGLLVTPGKLHELSAAITRLLGDASLRRRMGENGLQKARKSFSSDSMARSYSAVYRQVLPGNRRDPAECFQKA
jgi:glycosyltransferase involved in cell wall biosynthesis